MKAIEDVTGQRVLTRIDINAPVEDGEVQSTKRFERHAETIRQLVEQNETVAVLAHQGRPGRDTHVSLDQHADILEEEAGVPVRYVDDNVGEDAIEAVRQSDGDEAVLLENVRFLDEELENQSPEEHAESELVQTLSQYFDVYVNDAFSAAHRPHASLVGFAPVMEARAGPVMQQEWEHTSTVRNGLERDTAMLVGGKKASDVIQVMEELVEEVDDFLVSGLVGELFLRAEGHDVGYDVRQDDTFMHEQWLENRDRITYLLDNYRDKLHLPQDLAFFNGAEVREEVPIEEAAKEKPYWDVGRRTVEQFSDVIQDAEAVYVKGAPGVFEDDRFRYGTRQMLEAIRSSAEFSVVGGGDTARAVDLCGFDDADFSHVSIAGGAYIRALTGEELPAVQALEEHG
ncbi:MAG: phosphoglycerate kinase [Candidatus Nanohaloarchaea archaeon]|nr:phosphoglycerate kinase [Candidatus Nanohaloarchaea archaeon]